jgi:hypothetical protein
LARPLLGGGLVLSFIHTLLTALFFVHMHVFSISSLSD